METTYSNAFHLKRSFAVRLQLLTNVPFPQINSSVSGVGTRTQRIDSLYSFFFPDGTQERELYGSIMGVMTVGRFNESAGTLSMSQNVSSSRLNPRLILDAVNNARQSGPITWEAELVTERSPSSGRPRYRFKYSSRVHRLSKVPPWLDPGIDLFVNAEAMLREAKYKLRYQLPEVVGIDKGHISTYMEGLVKGRLHNRAATLASALLGIWSQRDERDNRYTQLVDLIYPHCTEATKRQMETAEMVVVRPESSGS